MFLLREASRWKSDSGTERERYRTFERSDEKRSNEQRNSLLKDIYLHDPSVRWDSIIGLDAAKRTIKEAVVYPIRVGNRPLNGTGMPCHSFLSILNYSPESYHRGKHCFSTVRRAQAKTLLAKAVATECNTTFFNISASDDR